MIFRPLTWQRIAVVLAALNFAAAGFAIAEAEPLHAAAHVGLALGFGWWAQHLRQRRRDDELHDEMRDTLQSPLERLQALEGDVTRVQQELNEVQERLDFAERMLTQRQDPPPGRLGPER
ncbi:MAG: hypothetical protein DMD54_15555 [Gemmatimonadetes bacterium]|nr:MAG: hypothetical protein DMD54_15555 [Gemmatimonadota bacterium]